MSLAIRYVDFNQHGELGNTAWLYYRVDNINDLYCSPPSSIKSR